jgi:nucleotide-binding universal stress UspA family protein
MAGKEGVMRIKRILVPVDFSSPSLRALDEAVDLARTVDAKLTAVFVAAPLQYPSIFLGTAVGLGLLLAEERKWARKELGKLVARLSKRGVQCDALLEKGRPHERIVEAAKRTRADLIVMSTQGRTGFSHLMLGSVAEHVVRTAPCPVLVVRGPAIERRVGRRAPRKTRAKVAA